MVLISISGRFFSSAGLMMSSIINPAGRCIAGRSESEVFLACSEIFDLADAG